MTRVAVIGAGPSGLSVLRAFRVAQMKGWEIPEVVCFEKQEDWGGLWRYSWRTGLDENGEPVHGSMYRFLWSNGPKECMEFADYTFEQHFGKPLPSYLPRTLIYDYLTGRAEQAGLREWCRFSNPVRMIEWSEANKRFMVTAHDHTHDKVYDEEFDYVICASGHFSTPHVPNFPGFEQFSGRILHAHDFRDPGEFRGKDVLLIGRSYSAEDIGSQCWKFGARSITATYRSRPMGHQWPSNFTERPLLQSLSGNTARFADGSEQGVDAIILCTGYRHHYPFLKDDLRLITENRLWPLGLFKGVVWERNPRFFYVGAQDQYYTFNMFDVQAWYVRDVICGRIQLPTKDQMEGHCAAWRRREERLVDDEDSVRFQGSYVHDLLSESDYPRFDIEGINELFIEYEHDKKEDIMSFRDRSYRSLISQRPQPLHHTRWSEAMNDTIEAFMGNTRQAANAAVV